MIAFDERQIGGLNVQLWGNGPIPVLVFHGGPGSGLNPNHVSYFDPDRHCVVLFDQRGAGRSGEPGSLLANITHHILQDAEVLRADLGVEDWVVLGGSWGGAFALAYAHRNPERVRGLVVRSALVDCSGLEKWMLHDRAERFEAGITVREWFWAPLDSQERQQPVAAWFARMIDSSDHAREATRRVMALEDAFHGPDPGPVALSTVVGEQDIARTLLYLWYWMNAFFFSENAPANPELISDIPHRLTHGRNNLICPIENTIAFADRGTLSCDIIDDAGHDGLAEPMVAAVRNALSDLGF